MSLYETPSAFNSRRGNSVFLRLPQNLGSKSNGTAVRHCPQPNCRAQIARGHGGCRWYGAPEVERCHRGESQRSHRANACRSEEHTSELQSPCNLVCRLLLEK